MSSETTNDDANDDDGDFFVEPWTVRQLNEMLIVADETPAAENLVTTIIGPVVAAAAVLLIGWLVPDFVWLGYGIGALIIARALQLIIKGVPRPSRWEFLRASEEIRQNGKTLGRFADLSEVEIIETKVTYFSPDLSRSFKSEFQFTVQLRIANKEFGLGSYGTESAANRLAKAISGFLNKPLRHRTAPPVVNT